MGQLIDARTSCIRGLTINDMLIFKSLNACRIHYYNRTLRRHWPRWSGELERRGLYGIIYL